MKQNPALVTDEINRRIQEYEAFFLTEHYAMKAYRGSGGIAPSILDLGTRWR
jgi:hypothetical protein